MSTALLQDANVNDRPSPARRGSRSYKFISWDDVLAVANKLNPETDKLRDFADSQRYFINRLLVKIELYVDENCPDVYAALKRQSPLTPVVARRRLFQVVVKAFSTCTKDFAEDFDRYRFFLRVLRNGDRHMPVIEGVTRDFLQNFTRAIVEQVGPLPAPVPAPVPAPDAPVLGFSVLLYPTVQNGAPVTVLNTREVSWWCDRNENAEGFPARVGPLDVFNSPQGPQKGLSTDCHISFGALLLHYPGITLYYWYPTKGLPVSVILKQPDHKKVYLNVGLHASVADLFQKIRRRTALAFDGLDEYEMLLTDNLGTTLASTRPSDGYVPVVALKQPFELSRGSELVTVDPTPLEDMDDDSDGEELRQLLGNPPNTAPLTTHLDTFDDFDFDTIDGELFDDVDGALAPRFGSALRLGNSRNPSVRTLGGGVHVQSGLFL